MTPLSLTADLRRAYEEQGFVRLGRLLDEDEAAALRARIDALHRPSWPNPYGVIVNDAWRQDPALEAVVCGEAMGAAARALMGTDAAVLFQDNLVWKAPGAVRIEWHQDYSYQPLSAPLGVTLWLALDAADAHNGCLHYVPGTHRLGIRAPADFIRGTNQPQRSELPPLDIEAHLDEVVALPVRAGELLAHHPLVWHMSPANTSHRERRALSINWLHPEVRWMPSQAPHPFNYSLQPVDGQALDPGRFPVLRG